MLVHQRVYPIKSHEIPLNHHFPMVFLWFSYGLPEGKSSHPIWDVPARQSAAASGALAAAGCPRGASTPAPIWGPRNFTRRFHRYPLVN